MLGGGGRVLVHSDLKVIEYKVGGGGGDLQSNMISGSVEEKERKSKIWDGVLKL